MRSRSPGLRAPRRRCFFIEPKTSESSRSFQSSDSTCSTSMQLNNLYCKTPKGRKKILLTNDKSYITYQYHNELLMQYVCHQTPTQSSCDLADNSPNLR